MPNIKSAKKRVLVSERNYLRNHAYKSAVRTAMKRVLQSLKQKKDGTEIQAELNKAFSLIDRAVLKGILHKNTGARCKGRMAKAVNAHQAA